MPSLKPYDEDYSIPPNYINYKRISEDDLANIFKRLFDLQQFKNIKFQEKDTNRLEIYSNQEFWIKAENRDIFSGQAVRLKNFIITEWVPFSPGLFYTEEAMAARREAESFVNMEYREYTPKGKFSMVNGGVGALRLTPKVISTKEFNIWGATSTGIVHQGLPLLVNNDIYLKYIDQIKYNRGIRATIIGRLRLIQDSKIIRANYPLGIPKFCLEVQDFLDVEEVNVDILVAIAISYRNRSSDRLSPS